MGSVLSVMLVPDRHVELQLIRQARVRIQEAEVSRVQLSGCSHHARQGVNRRLAMAAHEMLFGSLVPPGSGKIVADPARRHA